MKNYTTTLAWPIYLAVTFLLIALKIGDVLSCSWLWVLLPVLLPIAVVLLAGIYLICIGLITEIQISKFETKQNVEDK